MGKTGKWLKSFLMGKKYKEKEKAKENFTSSQNSSVAPENPATPIQVLPTTPKEKRRWSFRRSSVTAAAPKDLTYAEQMPNPALQVTLESDGDLKKYAAPVAVPTATAADGRAGAVEEAAAIKIQSAFRAYLARKALFALKGLVKLQALVRGHLVRKQATATLRCMEALVTVQARALAQRARMAEEAKPGNHRPANHRKSSQDHRLRHTFHEFDKGLEENIKIVEMDFGEPKGSSKNKNSYSNHNAQMERAGHRYSKQENYQISPVPSAITDMTPRSYSGHFEDYPFSTAQSSPQSPSAVSKSDQSRTSFAFLRPEYAESMPYDHPLYPNYMANTESSKAKVRSQSAPKSRPDSLVRQPSRRKASMEGRIVPRAVRMQRSSSHAGATAQNYQHPWSIKLDRSTVSLVDSECGSTSTKLTNSNYCRSLVSYDPHGNRY